jgi:hypothetical protein
VFRATSGHPVTPPSLSLIKTWIKSLAHIHDMNGWGFFHPGVRGGITYFSVIIMEKEDEQVSEVYNLFDGDHDVLPWQSLEQVFSDHDSDINDIIRRGDVFMKLVVRNPDRTTTKYSSNESPEIIDSSRQFQTVPDSSRQFQTVPKFIGEYTLWLTFTLNQKEIEFELSVNADKTLRGNIVENIDHVKNIVEMTKSAFGRDGIDIFL